MVLTKTAIVFLLLGITLGICGWQFLGIFKKSSNKDRVGLLLGVFIFISAVQNIVLGIGTLFFIRNETALQYFFLLAQMLLALHATLGLYTVAYIFSKNIFVKIIAFIVGFLGAMATVLTATENPPAFITKFGSVDWLMGPSLSLLTFALLLASIGSFIYIFSQLYRSAISFSLKIFSLILSLAGMIALIGIFKIGRAHV